MSPSGDWQHKSVPKERCEEVKQQLRTDGWEVEDECPQNSEEPTDCIIKYRRNY